ncbi:hypothetical protein HanRHA438_Chr01g0009891 [Helianthus annuus]|nr:hypothetical protein HanRHA438_Chr01g0009891 [Helianthus annuus]
MATTQPPTWLCWYTQLCRCTQNVLEGYARRMFPLCFYKLCPEHTPLTSGLHSSCLRSSTGL